MKKSFLALALIVFSMLLVSCSSKEEYADAIDLAVELIEAELEDNDIEENVDDMEMESENNEDALDDAEDEEKSEVDDLEIDDEETDDSFESMEDVAESKAEDNLQHVSEQLEVIMNQKEVWEDSVQFEIFCYAVTDFNHNGLLEIMASSCQGTGMYTYSNIWEVNDTLDGLVQYEIGIIEGSSEPDFIINQITTYVDDESGRYYYMVDDYIRVGMAENYTSKQATFFEDNIMFVLYLGTKGEFYDADTEEISIIYEDADRIEITEDVYNELEENHFGSYEKKITYVNWIASSDEIWQNDKEGALLDSWVGFSMV
ncbi:MAG: hypothetical protein R3Y24_08245 [Eubacteriales bacterium]